MNIHIYMMKKKMEIARKWKLLKTNNSTVKHSFLRQEAPLVWQLPFFGPHSVTAIDGGRRKETSHIQG